jgi:hypothetical protein
MRVFLSLLILMTISSVVQTGHSYPKATDRAQRWQFRLDTGDLTFYRDSETGEGYWVLLYEVTNETKKDHNWTPSFTLVTDRGEMIQDSDNVPRKVQLSILDIFGDPLMVAQAEASGPLLQGSENAMRSYVVWKAGHEDVREIQVFAGGVSGDTAEVLHPITGEKKMLRRVIQLSWSLDGSVDQMLLKPMTKRPVDGGTSVRRLSTDDKDSIGGDTVQRKWIFR